MSAEQSTSESQPRCDNSSYQFLTRLAPPAISHSHDCSSWQPPESVYHHLQSYHHPQPPQRGYHHPQPPQPGYHHPQPPQSGYHYPQYPLSSYHHPQPLQPRYHHLQPPQPGYHPPQPLQPRYHHPQPPQPGYHHPQPPQPRYYHPQPPQPRYYHPQPPQPGYHHPQPPQPDRHQSHDFHLAMLQTTNTVLPPQPSQPGPIRMNPLAGNSTSPQLFNTPGCTAQTPNSTIQKYPSPGMCTILAPLMSRQQPMSAVQSYMSLPGTSTIEGSQPVIDPTQHTTLFPPSSHNVVMSAATDNLQSQANNSSVNMGGQVSHPPSPKRRRLNSPTNATRSHQQSSYNSQTQLELFSHTPQQSTVHAGGILVQPSHHNLVPATHDYSMHSASHFLHGSIRDESTVQNNHATSSNIDEVSLDSEDRIIRSQSRPLSIGGASHIAEQQSTPSANSILLNLPSLSIQDFENVYKAVHSARPHWYYIGLALGVSPPDLQSIQIKNQNSPFLTEDCLRDILHKRLGIEPKLTWTDVINALKSPTVGLDVLAAEIIERCCNQPPGVVPDGPSTSAATASSNTPLKNYADYLKDKYLKMTVLPDDWPPPLDRQDHFTNLALVERKKYTQLPGARKMESIEYDYAYGNVDNIIEKKKPIELKQIFDPLPGESTSQNRFTILMDGAPGVGKTTISRKICIDWAQGKLLSNHQLVPILIPLRQLVIRSTSNQEFTIEDLIPTDNLVLKTKFVEHIRETAGDGVMFIFDGFDELSNRQRTQHSLFLDIMKGNKLHNCSVLVTSRSYASGPLETIARINRHVEVLGFKKKQIRECIMKNIADKDKAKELNEILDDRMDILSLCYIPLNCRIVLYVYKQQYSLPDTLTKLFEVFILYTLKHYADKIALCSEVISVDKIRQTNELENLPSFIIDFVDHLSEMAYNGMTDDRLVFQIAELYDENKILSLGLLKMIEAIIKITEEKYYQFIHLTVQEFLAARHISTTRNREEKIAFLKSKVFEDRFRMTLRFLSGLTHLDFLPLEEAFPGKLMLKINASNLRDRKKNRSKFLFIAQLMYECRYSTCTCLLLSLQNSGSCNMSGYSLSQFDCIVLAHFLSTTPEDHIWDEINLTNCNLIPDRSKILLSKYHSKKRVPILSMTKKLSMDGNKSIPFTLFASVISESYWLQIVRVSDFQTTEKIHECEKVQAFLACIFNLKQFYSSHTILTQTGFSKKCNLSKLPLHTCLKSIRILQFFHFKELDLSEHPEVVQDCTNCGIVGDKAWKCLCELLAQVSGIEKITLPKMVEETMSSMITTLSTMNTLKSIKIQMNDEIILHGQVLSYILRYLQGQERSIEFHAYCEFMTLSVTEDKLFHIQNTFTANINSIIELQLLLLLTDTLPAQFNKIVFRTKYLTDHVMDCCGASNHLRTLMLCDCNNLPVHKLQSMLKATTSLQVLEISGCSVTDGEEFFKSIVMGLTENNSVQELIISNMNISSLTTQYSPSSDHTEQARVLNKLKLQLGTTGLKLSIRYLMRKFFYKIVDIEQTSGQCTKETLLSLIHSLQPSVLKVLKLKFLNLEPRECSLALATVLKQSQLEILGVSECDVTNELITGALTSLRELDISGNKGITSKALAALFQQSQLTVLKVDNCGLNDGVIAGIAYNVTSLEELDISNNSNITSKALATLLQQSQLTVLKACHCDLNDEVIAGIVCNVTSLRELDICNNKNITSKALTILLQQSQLTVLKVGQCDLNDEVIAGIACNVTSLRQLDISYNKNITSKSLARFLQQSQLTVLKVENCNLNDEVIVGISDNLASLRELCIGDNSRITGDSCIKLFNFLNQNTSLKKLAIWWINGNKRNDAMIRAMCDMIKDNKAMTELMIGTPLLNNNFDLLAEALVQNNTLEVFNTCNLNGKLDRHELEKIKISVAKQGHGITPKWMQKSCNN